MFGSKFALRDARDTAVLYPTTAVGYPLWPREAVPRWIFIDTANRLGWMIHNYYFPNYGHNLD